MIERTLARGVLPESHHPDADRLALHAAGQLRPIERVIVEAHLAFCAPCTDRLRELLDPGARWLQTVGREVVPGAVWERLSRSLEAPAGSAPGGDPPSRPTDPGAALPEALPRTAWEELGDPKPTLQWRPVLTSRARYCVLATDRVADSQLVLVKLVGGSRFPAHLHLGQEEMVILAGGYTDAFGHFEAGAYQRYAPGTEHSALSDAGETCFALGLIERGLRFRGLLGVLQWLFEPQARRGVQTAAAAD